MILNNSMPIQFQHDINDTGSCQKGLGYSKKGKPIADIGSIIFIHTQCVVDKMTFSV